ncbi:MAG: DUF4476 domain-containing protein [Bacteroidia bacterium]
MKNLFLLLTMVVGSQAWAQSNLNLFTEEGENFTLFLNGIQQNRKPQSTVKVQNILDNVQKIRLVFEDQNIQTISQNMFYENGKEYTYNVRKKNNKTNQVKRIDGKKTTPVIYVIRMQDVKTIEKKVIQSGDVMQDNLLEENEKTVTTKTVTTTYVGTDSMVMDLNSVLNNLSNAKTETTTTITTTTTSSTGNDNVSKPTVVCKPMSGVVFSNLTDQLKKQGFEDNKIQIVKQVMANNCLSAAQVKGLMKEFSFEENKLRVAKICYSKTTDKENYFTINDAFGFSSSVDEMSEFLKNKGALSTDGDY